MLSPLIITTEPLPTTTAACSDLIAVHVSRKEYHSVRAHNPGDDQARIIASSPNLLLATNGLPSQRPHPTSCIIHHNVHFHDNLPCSGKEVTPDQIEITCDPHPTQVLFLSNLPTLRQARLIRTHLRNRHFACPSSRISYLTPPQQQSNNKTTTC